MGQNAASLYVLRPTQESDISSLSVWLEDLDDLALFDRSMRVPMSPSATETFWKDIITDASQKERLWFTIDDPDGDPCGIIGLEGISVINGDAILATFMARSARNKGIGLKASALVLDIAFLQMRLHRLSSFYRADNDVSAYLIDQVGFQKEGLFRQAWFTNGRHEDTVAVGLLRDEWMKRRKSLAEGMKSDVVVSFGRKTPKTWSWPPLEGL